MQNGVQQRIMHLYLSILADESKFAVFVHEVADAGSGRSNHFLSGGRYRRLDREGVADTPRRGHGGRPLDNTGATQSGPDCLSSLIRGLSAGFADDHEQLKHGMIIYDAFYQWCRLHSGKS
jgi:hypothetical protein